MVKRIETVTGVSILVDEHEEQYVSRDGEPLAVDYCQCCRKKFPSGTLHIVGFRSRCDFCLLHCHIEGICQPKEAS